MIEVSRKAIQRKIVPDPESAEGHVGCYASVEVLVPIGANNYRLSQTLKSGGLWAIDITGPDDPYLAEVFAEEREQLEAVLTAFGVTVTN